MAGMEKGIFQADEYQLGLFKISDQRPVKLKNGV